MHLHYHFSLSPAGFGCAGMSSEQSRVIVLFWLTECVEQV